MRERIIANNYPEDWERYTFVETVYEPTKMTARRLDETMYELRKAAAVEPWVWKRTLKTLWNTRSLSTAIFVHGMNKGWVRIARQQVARDAEKFASVVPVPSQSAKIHRAFALCTGRPPKQARQAATA